MGGACSDPSSHLAGTTTLVDTNTAFPALTTSAGQPTGYTFGGPTGFKVVEEVHEHVEEVPVPSVTTTYYSQPITEIPTYASPVDQVVASGYNVNGGYSSTYSATKTPVVDFGDKMFLTERKSAVTSKASRIVNEFVGVNNEIIQPATTTTTVERVSSIRQVPTSQVVTTQVSAAPQQTQYVIAPNYVSQVAQPQASVAYVQQPIISQVPAQPQLPFEGNLVASKIDIYGHRAWQDGNVIVQTNNGSQAYQQLDIYGNRRRDFVFQA